jgi:hypothetical protein
MRRVYRITVSKMDDWTSKHQQISRNLAKCAVCDFSATEARGGRVQVTELAESASRKDPAMNKISIVALLAAVTATSGLALACPGHEGGKTSADANKDGKVTLQEAQAKAKSRFEKMDKNKNGVLAKDELEGRAKRMERADANKDGLVTFAESQTLVQAWFQKHDQNKDGALSGDELPHGKRGHGEGRGPKA